MKLRNRLVIVVVATILFIGIAILIWANQTHRITIWGEGPGEPYPVINNGKAIAIDGMLTKNGDLFVLTKNNLYPYDIFILNSPEISANLEPLLNKSVSAYGSLSGSTDNMLLVLWLNGKTLFTEEQGFVAYYNRVNKNATDAIESMTEAQRNCIIQITTLEEYKVLLTSESLSNLLSDKKEAIYKCINEAK